MLKSHRLTLKKKFFIVLLCVSFLGGAEILIFLLFASNKVRESKKEIVAVWINIEN